MLLHLLSSAESFEHNRVCLPGDGRLSCDVQLFATICHAAVAVWTETASIQTACEQTRSSPQKGKMLYAFSEGQPQAHGLCLKCSSAIL